MAAVLPRRDRQKFRILCALDRSLPSRGGPKELFLTTGDMSEEILFVINQT